jgi:hypothetical protein
MTSQLPLTGLSLVGVADTLSPTLGEQLPQSGSNLASEQSQDVTPPMTITVPTHEIQNPTGTLGWRPARIAAGVIGVLLIAGGIFALKPVHETVSKAVETGRKVAETAAVAAA